MGQSFTDRVLGQRRQEGFTLIEALVSVALVSTVILSLSAGLLASVRSSRVAKETQQIDAALSAYSEEVKSVPLSTCPPTGTIPLAVPIPDYTGEVTSVESYAAGDWQATCSNPPYRMVIKVEDVDDSSNTTTAQVVVGQP